jgi:hypothetical protein
MTVRIWGLLCAVALLATAACTGSGFGVPGFLASASPTASGGVTSSPSSVTPAPTPTATQTPSPSATATQSASSACPPFCTPTPTPRPSLAPPTPTPPPGVTATPAIPGPLPQLVSAQPGTQSAGNYTLLFGFQNAPALWFGPLVYSNNGLIPNPTVGPLQQVATPAGTWPANETFYRVDVTGLYGDIDYVIAFTPRSFGVCCTDRLIVGSFWVNGVPSPTPTPPSLPTPTPSPGSPTPKPTPTVIATCAPLPGTPKVLYPADGATGVPIPGGSLTIQYLFYPTQWVWWEPSFSAPPPAPAPVVGGLYGAVPGAPSPPPGGSVAYTQTVSNLAPHTAYTIVFSLRSTQPTPPYCALPALAFISRFTTQ